MYTFYKHKIIAFANQKGGVGKTTCCVNLAAALSISGKKVLLIDMDPQGNATMGSGINKNAIEHSLNEVLLGTMAIEKVRIQHMPAGYDLIPGNGSLTNAEVTLLQQQKREYKLKESINNAGFDQKYDYILLDCPPSLNMLTINALVAATDIMIPMQCEYYALEGLSALLNTMQQLKAFANKNLKLEGIILTMYDPRNRLATDIEQQLKEYFPNKVYKTVIPRNVRLAEAPSHGLPIMLYDKNSKGAIAYLSLAGEILKHHANKQEINAEMEDLI